MHIDILTYFNYFRSNSPRAPKNLEPKLEPEKALQEQPYREVARLIIPGTLYIKLWRGPEDPGLQHK